MTHEEDQLLKLGREVLRMIRDLIAAQQGDLAYARKTLTFPGGSVTLLVVNDGKLVDLFDNVATAQYNVGNVTPPSEVN